MTQGKWYVCPETRVTQPVSLEEGIQAGVGGGMEMALERVLGCLSVSSLSTPALSRQSCHRPTRTLRPPGLWK